MRGSKRRRPSGSWELRCYVGIDPTTGKERTITRTFRGSARGADIALRELAGEAEDGRLGGAETTVRTLLERWLAHIAARDRSPTTMREYRRLISKTINPTLGHVQIRKLRVPQLDNFYDSLIRRGLSPGSVRQVHSILRTAIEQAVRWGWVPANVVRQASPPTVRRTEVESPTPAQVQKLIRYAEGDDPEMAALIALAAATGARRGELCALRWSDVNWAKKTLTIRRSLAVMGRGNRVEKGTKTHANREVSLDEFGIGVLQSHRARAELEAARRGVELTLDGPIISYDLARTISPDTATHYVKAAAAACGFRTHLHAIRHFSASEMVAAGVNVRTVAERLGHADPSTTLRIYAHALPERDREAAAVLGRILTKAIEGPRTPKTPARKQGSAT